MKNSFVRNSFVVSRNLAFRDKARELSRKGAKSSEGSEGSPMVFEYSHGAPSYPADVLADCYRRGYIPPEDDGTPPESQVFVVTASGSVTQPLQWSSEYADTDLALVYYNYRHYNPLDGRWTGRDVIRRLNMYVYAKMAFMVDLLGLKVFWASRNLENILGKFGIGNHHFIVMQFDSKSDAPKGSSPTKIECDCDQKDPVWIVCLDLTTVNKNGKKCVLIKENDPADVAAFKAGYCGEKDSKGFQGKEVNTPAGITPEGFEQEIFDAFQRSKEKLNSEERKYDVLDANCATWVNDLFDHVGVSAEDRDALSNFHGIDVGENDSAFFDGFE